MKRNNLLVMPVLAGVFALAACASGPQTPSAPSAQPAPVAAQGSRGPVKAIDYSIIDWQGASLGRDEPDWVYDAIDENKEALKAKVPELKNKDIYIFKVEGGDLDMIRATAQVTAFAEISNHIKTGVSADAASHLKGSKDEIESKRQFIETTAATASKNVISGFTRSRDFWQKMKYNNGKVTVQYLAIYAIGTEDLRRQLDIALGKVEAKTADEREAKEAIRQAVKEAKSLL